MIQLKIIMMLYTYGYEQVILDIIGRPGVMDMNKLDQISLGDQEVPTMFTLCETEVPQSPCILAVSIKDGEEMNNSLLSRRSNLVITLA